jgi:ADP-ribose pyrophosphatase
MSEKIVRSEYLYRGHLIKLRLDQVRLPTKQIIAREVVEHRGAVAIVAIDKDGCVVLVRQYRSGVAQELLEIPAGSLEDGEDVTACAMRELEEETGYRAMQWDPLGYFYSCPGFCTEKMHLFLAQQLTPGTAAPEEDELIRVETVPFEKAIGMIEHGEIVDAKTIAGLYRVHGLQSS